MAASRTTGYGRGEIEPGIAALVEALNAAGYETFSSCEGHPNQDPDIPRFPLVSFYADEAKARTVHVALKGVREELKCSWTLKAGFVMPRGANEWALGWTVENRGVTAEVDTKEQFEQLTVEVAREHDIPILIRMFESLPAAKA